MSKPGEAGQLLLEESVVEWLEGERLGMSRTQLVAEIDRLARHCNVWPVATRAEWEAAIDSVVKQGLVTEQDGVLRVRTNELPAEKTATQMDLF